MSADQKLIDILVPILKNSIVHLPEEEKTKLLNRLEEDAKWKDYFDIKSVMIWMLGMYSRDLSSFVRNNWAFNETSDGFTNTINPKQYAEELDLDNEFLQCSRFAVTNRRSVNLYKYLYDEYMTTLRHKVFIDVRDDDPDIDRMLDVYAKFPSDVIDRIVQTDPDKMIKFLKLDKEDLIDSVYKTNQADQNSVIRPSV